MSALADVTTATRCWFIHDGYNAQCELPAGHYGSHEAHADMGRIGLAWIAFGAPA